MESGLGCAKGGFVQDLQGLQMFKEGLYVEVDAMHELCKDSCMCAKQGLKRKQIQRKSKRCSVTFCKADTIRFTLSFYLEL